MISGKLPRRTLAASCLITFSLFLSQLLTCSASNVGEAESAAARILQELTRTSGGRRGLQATAPTVLVIGGRTAVDDQLGQSTAETSTLNGNWLPTGRMVERRTDFRAVKLRTGDAFAVGGLGTVRGEVFSAKSRRWFPTKAATLPGRRGFTATVLKDGRVLIAGGQDANGEFRSAVEVFSPRCACFVKVAHMRIPRVNHEAVLLPDGRVLVVGGQTTGFVNVQASAEIYDPKTNRWKYTGRMANVRTNFGLTLLRNGDVLASHGEDGRSTKQRTSETWSPKTGKWTPAGAPKFARQSFKLLTTAVGAIAVGGRRQSSAETYDAKSRSWKLVAARMSSSRANLAAAKLPDGRVLAVGGTANGRTALRTTEVLGGGRWSTATRRLKASRGREQAQIVVL